MFIKKKVSEHGINHPKNHAPFFTWWSPSEGRGKKTEKVEFFLADF